MVFCAPESDMGQLVAASSLTCQDNRGQSRHTARTAFTSTVSRYRCKVASAGKQAAAEIAPFQTASDSNQATREVHFL
jgi:hypothetical protein